MSSAAMQLLESMNRYPAKEYRINDGTVEARILNYGPDQENTWRELSPEQLSSHVMHNTAIARWLERRWGWRRLLRACVGLEPTRNWRRAPGETYEEP
jgi:hypothetical protein